jgi:hypothetical protein
MMKLFAVVALFACAAAPSLPAAAQVLPPYARPGGEEIHGQISSINGTFNLTLRDDRGFLDNVQLHQGTVILPTGLTLEPGMVVSIRGYAQGSAFAADEIDAPYRYAGALPVPLYYGPGWWYPGYRYGYGPSFSLFVSSGPYLVREPWRGFWYVGPRGRYGGYGAGLRYYNLRYHGYRPIPQRRDERGPHGHRHGQGHGRGSGPMK